MGVKGSMARVNRAEVSQLLTHFWARRNHSYLLACRQKKRLTTRRQKVNISDPPRATPHQLYRKPITGPWAATFRATMAIRGRGGTKDSTIASRMGTSGPNPSKLSSRCCQNSSEVI